VKHGDSCAQGCGTPKQRFRRAWRPGGRFSPRRHCYGHAQGQQDTEQQDVVRPGKLQQDQINEKLGWPGRGEIAAGQHPVLPQTQHANSAEAQPGEHHALLA
jgi:hypothetical protein